MNSSHGRSNLVGQPSLLTASSYLPNWTLSSMQSIRPLSSMQSTGLLGRGGSMRKDNLAPSLDRRGSLVRGLSVSRQRVQQASAAACWTQTPEHAWCISPALTARGAGWSWLLISLQTMSADPKTALVSQCLSASMTCRWAG